MLAVAMVKKSKQFFLRPYPTTNRTLLLKSKFKKPRTAVRDGIMRVNLKINACHGFGTFLEQGNKCRETFPPVL